MRRERKTREETKQQTREALLRAALELFVERGIDGPSLDAICERAGYTRGAFYVHFSSREDLLVGVMERILMEFTDSIIQTTDAGGDLVRSVTHFAERVEALGRSDASPFLAVGQAHLQVLVEACRRSAAIQARFLGLVEAAIIRLAEVVKSGQAAGTVRSDVPADLAAELLIFAVFGILTLKETGFERDVTKTSAVALRLLAPL